jgi:hypothetical protein
VTVTTELVEVANKRLRAARTVGIRTLVGIAAGTAHTVMVTVATGLVRPAMEAGQILMAVTA